MTATPLPAPHAAALTELERHLGPAALLSLDARGLLPSAGSGHATTRSGKALVDRIAGALVGAVVGSAVGRRWEWVPVEHLPSDAALADLPDGARGTADVQLLARSLEAQLDAGLGAPVRLAGELTGGLRLRNPGNAVPAVADRLRQGMPWFEAGVGSFGSGAVVRAVAAGITFRADPAVRPLLAAADCAVTHATVEAVAVAGAVADIVALLFDAGPAGGPAGRVVDEEAILDVLRSRPELRRTLKALTRRLRRPSQAPAGAEANAVLAAALAHTVAHDARPEPAILAAVRAGGDTDTVAALVGAFCGAARGVDAVPERWRASVRGGRRMDRLAAGAAGVPAAGRDGRAAERERPDQPARSDGLHISVLLDRSGSMAPIADDVVGGFNQFLADHRGIDGCRLTLVQFDGTDPFEVLLDDVAAAGAPDLRPDQFVPRGNTPLYDAIGALIERAERRQVGEASQVVVVFTDGMENASRRWDRESVFRRVEALQEAGWVFVFMGANQDSYAEGGRIGMKAGNTSNYKVSGEGVRAAWGSMSRASVAYAAKPAPARLESREDWFEGVKEAE